MSKKNSISNNKVVIDNYIKYLVLNYENFTKINTRILQKSFLVHIVLKIILLLGI